VPHSIASGNPLAPADDAKAATRLNREAGRVFRDRGTLQGPNAMSLCGFDKCLQQRTAKATPASFGRHVDSDFGNAGVTRAL
jgi:hypothetical protein